MKRRVTPSANNPPYELKDTVTKNPFTLLRQSRPLGHESRGFDRHASPTGAGSTGIEMALFHSSPRRVFWTTVILFTLLEWLVAAQAIFAWRDQMLTASQMQARGIDHGLPFLWHFAMWSDFAIISPLAAYLWHVFSKGWSGKHLLASFAIGSAASCLLHLFYLSAQAPEAHVLNHRLTAAGIGHLVLLSQKVAGDN